jgi:hypothetical protein
MLSGQDLAQDICDPASPNYSIESKNWFENNLGLAWVGNSTATSVLGEPGDFIGDGLNLALDAGQTDPDILSLMAGPATVSFRYDSPELGIASAVRTDHGRLFYMGFGIEGIVDTRGAVAILLDRICMALFDPTDVESAESFALSLDGNYPNPFNPKTSISFQSTSAGTGELRVLDVRGRQVHSETILVSEGRNQVEFNGESLSSAVYLYQVIMSNESVSGRMVLAK